MIFSELNSGTSVEGNSIEVFKSDMIAEKYLYLMAGTHGDEVEGVYVLNKLFQWLQDDHSLKDLPIVVIPILNPDGYRSQSRVNSHAVDLNRNYPTSDWSPDYSQDKYNPGPSPLSEPENAFLEKLFMKYPPGLILSFHSWKRLLNYNGDAEDIAEYIASYNQYEVCDNVGYSTPGSLGTYVPEKFNSPVITYECPTLDDKLNLKTIWEENEKGLKNFMQSNLLFEKLS